MIGPALLVAPVYLPGRTTRAVYLPRGPNQTRAAAPTTTGGGAEADADAEEKPARPGAVGVEPGEWWCDPRSGAWFPGGSLLPAVAAPVSAGLSPVFARAGFGCPLAGGAVALFVQPGASLGSTAGAAAWEDDGVGQGAPAVVVVVRAVVVEADAGAARPRVLSLRAEAHAYDGGRCALSLNLASNPHAPAVGGSPGSPDALAPSALNPEPRLPEDQPAALPYPTVECWCPPGDAWAMRCEATGRQSELVDADAGEGASGRQSAWPWKASGVKCHVLRIPLNWSQ